MRVESFRVGRDHVLGSGREGGREGESKRQRKSERARERVGRDHILDKLPTDRYGTCHKYMMGSAKHLSSEYGTYKTVKARCWPWLSGESPLSLLSCSLFARKRYGTCHSQSGGQQQM